MNREETTPSQRSRLVYVYGRQSSPRLVRENLKPPPETVPLRGAGATRRGSCAAPR
jgi:hypothetical protein